MAKGRKKKPEPLGMFQAVYEKLSRRIRRQRALFIPRFLYAAGFDNKWAGPARDNAYQIVLRWAERESAGLLAQDRETSIDTQFLDQVFGEGWNVKARVFEPSRVVTPPIE